MDSITDLDIERMTAELDVNMFEDEFEELENQRQSISVRRKKKILVNEYGRQLKRNISRKIARFERDKETGVTVFLPPNRSHVARFSKGIMTLQGFLPPPPRRWTGDDVRQLRQLYKTTLSAREIGKRTRRSPSSLYHKASRLMIRRR